MTTKHQNTIEQCTNALTGGHCIFKSTVKQWIDEESFSMSKDQYLNRKSQLISMIKSNTTAVHKLREHKNSLKKEGKGRETNFYSFKRQELRVSSCILHLRLAALKKASAERFIQQKAVLSTKAA